jgi:catalase
MTSNLNPTHHSLHSRASHFRSLINKEGKVHVHGTRRFQNPFADFIIERQLAHFDKVDPAYGNGVRTVLKTKKTKREKL